MWIARDKEGDSLCLYIIKPSMNDDGNWTVNPNNDPDKDWDYRYSYFQIDDYICPELTWEDEPIEVHLHNDDKVEELVKEFIGSLYDDLKNNEMTRDECVYFGTQCFMSYFGNVFNHLSLK